jgi:hypothetical protein
MGEREPSHALPIWHSIASKRLAASLNARSRVCRRNAGLSIKLGEQIIATEAVPEASSQAMTTAAKARNNRHDVTRALEALMQQQPPRQAQNLAFPSRMRDRTDQRLASHATLNPLLTCFLA